jgi:phage tail-like protein
MFEYPHVGYHFLVTFEYFPQSLKDISFQEVSGLTANVQTEDFREGGENRFIHHLPTRTSFPDLTLKRGLFLDAQLLGISDWFRKAVEDFKFEPVNLIVSLLNEQHLPLFNWYVVGAIPKKLEISGFNATSSQAVVETMVLDYRYFTFMKEASLAVGAAGAIGGAISGSASFSLG